MYKNSNINDRNMLLPGYLKSGTDYDRFSSDILNELKKEYGYGIKLPAKVQGGYRKYDVLLVIEDVFSDRYNLIINCLKNMFAGLEDGKVYSLLFNALVRDNDTTVSVRNSLLVTKQTSVDILTKVLITNLINLEALYKFYSAYTLVVQGKVWYSKEDILNEIKEKSALSSKGKLIAIDSADSGLISSTTVQLETDKKFDSINEAISEELCSVLQKEEYGGVRDQSFLLKNFKNVRRKSLEIQLSPRNITKLKVLTGDYSYTLYSYKKASARFINGVNLLCFHHINEDIYQVIENGYVIACWSDTDIGENRVLRIFDRNKVLFKKAPQNLTYAAALREHVQKWKSRGKGINKYVSTASDIIEINLGYNFRSLRETAKSPIMDLNIGVIDLETFKFNKKGSQQVFAGGWGVKNKRTLYYIDEFENYDSIKLIRKLFLDIIKSEYYNYTFFVHNLSGFDYIFILNALTTEFDTTQEGNFILKPIIKDDNTLVSLKITKKIVIEKKVYIKKVEHIKKIEVKRTMTLLDSKLFLRASLRKLVKEFNCSVDKGHFPYEFISSDTLLYKGKTPCFDYFPDLSFKEYKELFPEDYVYDVKLETLKYLDKDLLTLMEVLNKFNHIISKEFGINLTSSKTISGLSLNIYLSNFYNKKFDIKEIRGGIENEIRKAYFGGTVILPKKGVIINNGKKGYYYDFNSFYPSLMLKPMPVCNPTLSSSTNLDSYFGFCYAKIIPPEGLENYLVPKRDLDGKVFFPSKPFTGIFWSELLKASREYGYKIEVLGGFKFKKDNNLFSPFVNNIYSKRLKAKKDGHTALAFTFKLILNSLYGRFGMKQIENKIVIVDKNEAEVLLRKKNISLYNEMNDRILIRYNTNINYKILRLVENNLSEGRVDYLANLVKQRGVPSSVAIAAAITSYALIELMKYKNIKQNKLLYSDTDSVLLEKPLDSDLVSQTELGKLKLEHVITEGYFISPKFYAFINENGELILKSKGIKEGQITFDDFKKLAKGENLKIKSTVFVKRLNEGTVDIIDREYNITGPSLK